MTTTTPTDGGTPDWPTVALPGASPRARDLSYRGAHWRVAKARGPARDHPCASCGRPAAEWAYAGPHPAPLTDPHGRAYSLDPRHYVPRCRPCHAAADAPTTCRRGHPWSEATTYWRRTGTRMCRACRAIRDSRRAT